MAVIQGVLKSSGLDARSSFVNKEENRMEFFNAETRELKLVTEIKGDELITDKYQFPIFVKGVYTKIAIDLGVEVEENGYAVSGELFVKLANYFVELYGNKFTYDELVDGLDARKIVPTFIEMLFSVLQGDPKNE